MKATNSGLIKPIDKNEMKELLKETKEKIAGNTFGLVDLWRMQKKHKTLGSSTRW